MRGGCVWRGICWLVQVACVLLGGWWMGHAQNVGIGTQTPHSTARLEIMDTIRGLLIPRLTTRQRDMIADPAHTLIIFNIDSFCLEVYDTVTAQWYTIACPRNCQSPGCNLSFYPMGFACRGQMLTLQANCPDATAFHWMLPAGWTVVSQTVNSITVQVDTPGGVVQVVACNLCGCTDTVSQYIQVDTCSSLCLDWAQVGELHRIRRGPGNTLLVVAGGGHLIQMDAMGTVLLNRKYPALSDVRDVLYHSSGLVYLTGCTNAGGIGASDIFLSAIDLNTGNVLWTKVYGGANAECGYALAEGAQGTIYIVGYSRSWTNGGADGVILHVDATGNVLQGWHLGGGGEERFYDAVSVGGGDLIVGGLVPFANIGNEDYLVFRMTAQGTVVWKKGLGTNKREAYGVVLERYGDTLFVGGGWRYQSPPPLLTFDGNSELFALKVNTGDAYWHGEYDFFDVDHITGLGVSGGKGYLLSVGHMDFGDPLGRVTVAAFNLSNGTLFWQRYTVYDIADGDLAGLPGNIVVAGYRVSPQIAVIVDDKNCCLQPTPPATPSASTVVVTTSLYTLQVINPADITVLPMGANGQVGGSMTVNCVE